MKRIYTLTYVLAMMMCVPLTANAQAGFAKKAHKAEDMQIISERPAGKVINMSREGLMQTRIHTPSGDVPETHYLGNIVSEVVEGDDGFIYLKNPTTYFFTNSYIKGERTNDGKVVFHTPQPVDKQGNSIFYIGKISMRDVSDYGDSQYAYPTDAEGFDIVFDYTDGVLREQRQMTSSYDGEGKLVQVETSPMLALVSERYITDKTIDSYTGYADYNLVLEPVTDEVNLLPESAKVETYQLKYFYMGVQANGFVKVAFVGNDVYLNAFSDYMDNAWAKGVINGETITFNGPQYLGQYTNATTRPEYAHIYFMPCTPDLSSPGDEAYVPVSQIVFNYDPASKTMTSDGSFAISAGKKEVNEFVVYGSPNIFPFVENMTELKSPVIESDECGFGRFFNDDGTPVNSFAVRLFDQDVEGNLLNWSNLSYTIYRDEVPVTLTRAEFPLMPEEYIGGTEFPFIAMEDENLHFDTSDMVYYFYDEPKVMSVRMNYVDQDGNVHHSKRNGYDYVNKTVLADMGEPVIPNSINNSLSINDGAKTVYDLQGRRIDTPLKGINIVRSANGKTYKVIK